MITLCFADFCPSLQTMQMHFSAFIRPGRETFYLFDLSEVITQPI